MNINKFREISYWVTTGPAWLLVFRDTSAIELHMHSLIERDCTKVSLARKFSLHMALTILPAISSESAAPKIWSQISKDRRFKNAAPSAPTVSRTYECLRC